MKRYIRSSWSDYSPSQDESSLINQYVDDIEDLLLGYSYVEKGVPFLGIPDSVLNVTDIVETKTEVMVGDRPPYTKKLIIRVVANVDMNLNEIGSMQTKHAFERVFSRAADEISELIENEIPNSVCSAVTYANSLGFEVVIELK